MSSKRNNGSKTYTDAATGKFKPGNPGRPKGARHRATLAAQALIDDQAETITRTVIDAALGGDTVALKLVMDRICPPRRDTPTPGFELPEMRTAADAAGAISSIMASVAAGDLTVSEASTLSRIVGEFSQTLIAAEFEQRLEALENADSNSGKAARGAGGGRGRPRG